MSSSVQDEMTLLEPHDLTFMAGAPYLYHCHHYNLFHDQTVDDVLGEEAGQRVRFEAARAAYHGLLAPLSARLDKRTPAERIELAQELFRATGHGRMSLDITADGGTARGEYLHYGYTWSEKYGDAVRRLETADAVAAGFAAAATQVAFGLPDGSIGARERQCVARREPVCEFALSRRTPGPGIAAPVTEEDFKRHLGGSRGGQHEEQIGAIADALQGFVKGVGGDERGLVDAFGVFVTLHLANYYDQTAYEAVRHIEQAAPSSVGLCEALLREAGHVCVFNTFGGILASPEWEAVAYPLSGDPLEIIKGGAAIARGLGFGRWSVDEYVPGQRLVMCASSNYEAPFYLARYGRSDKPRCYFFQGAALAIMVLAHRVKWQEKPRLSQALYNELFRGAGLGFEVTANRCATRGDDCTEVVVRAT